MRDLDIARGSLKKHIDLEKKNATRAIATIWSEAMRALGGEYANFAEFPTQEDLVWEELQALWEQQRNELQRRIDLHAVRPG